MNNILLVVAIVVAVFVIGIIGVFVAKKLGLTVINVVLTIVTAIKNALTDSGLANDRVKEILGYIVQGIAYAQSVADTTTSISEKVENALDYVKTIASELGAKLSETDINIIENVLKVGFLLMGSLGVTSNVNSVKLYSQLAKYSGTDEKVKAIGLKNIR